MKTGGAKSNKSKKPVKKSKTPVKKSKTPVKKSKTPVKKSKSMKGGMESSGATYMDQRFFNPDAHLATSGELSGNGTMSAYGPIVSGDVGTGMLAPYTSSNCDTANHNTMMKTGGMKGGKGSSGAIPNISDGPVVSTQNKINGAITGFSNFMQKLDEDYLKSVEYVKSIKVGNQRLIQGGKKSKSKSKTPVKKSKSFVNTYITPVKKFISNSYDSTKDYIVKKSPSVKKSISNSYSSTKEYIKKKSPGVKKSISNSYESTKKFIKKKSPVVKKSIADTYESTKKFIKKATTPVKKSKSKSKSKSSSKPKSIKKGGSNGSDFALTLNSRGPVNAPDDYWGVPGEQWFRQFNKTGDYIPNSQLAVAATPLLAGKGDSNIVTGFDEMGFDYGTA